MAQDSEEQKEPPSMASDEEIPSLLFLEFLGEFETEEGDWINPEELEEMELDDSRENEDEEQ